MFSKKISTKVYCSNSGFSLIELLVSISIIILVSGVVIARNNAFEGAILLRNQAYLVASTIREAQLLAVSGTGVTNEVQRYGVHVDAGTRQIIIFKDNNGNRHYESSELINQIQLDRRFEVSEIVIGNTNYTNASVTFTRPNYDASFCTINNCTNVSNLTAGPIHIQVRRVGRTGSGAGDVRRVSINGSGQVSVTTLP